MKKSDGKYAYVSLVLRHSRGIETKLIEQAASVERTNVDLDVIWLTAASSRTNGRFIVKDVQSGSRLGSRIRQIKEVKRLQSAYNGLLLRYPLCDPLTFGFLTRLRNVASEHHTKEIAELWVAKDPRIVSEALLGTSFLRRFQGYFGVTDEILDYERSRAGVQRPGFVTYNAISPARYPESARSSPLFAARPLKLVFASGSFPAWQGLDLVIDSFRTSGSDCELHLCGQLGNEQAESLRNVPNVKVHGSLGPQDLLKVYADCDVGVASFGLHRNNLKEGTSLKVREYLACGLPVVLGHHDPAFPKGFPFILEQSRFDVGAILRWCQAMQPVTRRRVFETSENFISVDTLVRRQFEGLDTLFGGKSSRL